MIHGDTSQSSGAVDVVNYCNQKPFDDIIHDYRLHHRTVPRSHWTMFKMIHDFRLHPGALRPEVIWWRPDDPQGGPREPQQRWGPVGGDSREGVRHPRLQVTGPLRQGDPHGVCRWVSGMRCLTMFFLLLFFQTCMYFYISLLCVAALLRGGGWVGAVCTLFVWVSFGSFSLHVYSLCVSDTVNTQGFVWKFYVPYTYMFIHSLSHLFLNSCHWPSRIQLTEQPPAVHLKVAEKLIGWHGQKFAWQSCFLHQIVNGLWQPWFCSCHRNLTVCVHFQRCSFSVGVFLADEPERVNPSLLQQL